MNDKLRSICIYCGSATGADTQYAAAARELSREIVKRNMRLVYGGASIGLMGVVADTVLEAGGDAIGVLPKNLFRKEVPHENLTRMILVDSMHERKAKMAELADGFIALPGGLGTLEELLEMLTWSQLKIHEKPCAMLNVSGYYDQLIEFLDHSVLQGFIRSAHREMLIIDSQPAVLLDACESFSRPDVQKWAELDN
ncbi:MAG: TIGR00730 family Rossman fold protein [Gammaproteobacteria bacterium]|nr:TIGR00730 family Rossman fold protein [Gammaproteobacteria bacterium]